MSINVEQTIIEFITEKISPYLIILFGSTVKGTTHSNSDIDIAYLTDEKKLDKYEIFMLSQELATMLNRDVDLVDLDSANTVFQAQIIHTGKIIYCCDKNKKAQFEMKALKMYAKLNEERAVILKKIDESGSIYEN